MADETFSSNALIEIFFSFKFLFSSYPAAPRNTDLDQTFYCNYIDVHGAQDAGIPKIEVSLTGAWLNQWFGGEAIDIILAPLGTWDVSEFLITDSIIEISVGFSSGLLETEFITTSSSAEAPYGSNKIKWSNIGSMDFTIGKDNVAGSRVLDLAGWIYQIFMLEGAAITGGMNGITILTPTSNVGDRGQISRVPIANTYSPKIIYDIGLKGKMAMIGSKTDVFFVDNVGQLGRLNKDGLKILDYSEYLSPLSSSINLSLDLENGLLYICDGVYGYVYNTRMNSLGECSINITGLGSKSGTKYITAPDTILMPTFEIWTDIIDMSTRKSKTIYNIEVGTNITVDLYASIKYRNNKASAFSQTHWQLVDPGGIAYLFCFGREFMLGLKNLEYSYFEVDYMKARGIINDI